MKNNLSSQFNIKNVKFAYDNEENQKICIFEVGDISAEKISELGLKIREEAYNYAKKNNLIDYYNNFVFLVRRWEDEMMYDESFEEFKPLDFYEIADKLKNDSSNNATLRTIVNRAYYSAFL